MRKLKSLGLSFVVLGILVFLPALANACTNHAQCSQECNNLGWESFYPRGTFIGYGNCPYGVYGCMVRDCCIGQCNYWETNECFCLHTTHVDIYGDVCPSGSVCGNDCRCHPEAVVCTPGEVRNRVCACATQYQYEKCKSDGSGWETIIVNCPSGQVCENGYCVQKVCFDCNSLDGWYDRTEERCNMNSKECGGGVKERKQEYRDYYPTITCPCSSSQCSFTVTDARWASIGSCYTECPSGYTCDSGYCVFIPTCTEKYLDEYSCSGNWKQRKYQNSDCTFTWQNYEYCPYGCSNGNCLSQECTPKYLNSWQCSGNWRQQLYQNSDCSTQWKNVEYCPYGCSGGYCISEQLCHISASVSTPADVYLGDTVYSTITLWNSGDAQGYVNFNAYVCRSDGYNCQQMSCDGLDPSVYVPGYGTRSFTCSRAADELSAHKIKLDYSGCDTVDPTIFSGVFEVKPRYYPPYPHPGCTEGFLNEFQCLGNWKQQLYQFADCRTEWRNVLFCGSGCSAGKCSAAQNQGVPEIQLDPEYVVYRCEKNKLKFDIINTGEARDSFDISFSGSAARWIRPVSSVSIDPWETRTVTFYASVPCDAEGEFDLTVSAADGSKDSATTSLSVAEGRFLLPITGWTASLKTALYVVAFLVVVGTVFVLLLLFVWGLPKKKACPESFRQGMNFAKKKPESFADRECRKKVLPPLSI